MIMTRRAIRPLCLLFVLGILLAPIGTRAQRRRELQPPQDDAYGTQFFDQLHSLFGKFRDADLQRAFQQAKAIQCTDLVSGKGEWRPVAFFNDDRKLGDWCRESLEEVRTDLSVYTFRGTCRGEEGSVQVSTEFPVGESVEAYNDRKIDLDQVDVNVNDPVSVVFDQKTLAYTFDLPYMFLVGRQGAVNIYSFIAPRREDAYARDVTSHWDCKSITSSDLTYKFLICRTATVPRGPASRRENLELSFGASAFFILSDGMEAKTSVNLSFGDSSRPATDAPAAAKDDEPAPRAAPTVPAVTKPPATWQKLQPGATFADIRNGEYRLHFSPQAWTGKITSPQVLADQKMSSLQAAGVQEGVDYCIWHPGLLNMVDRLVENPADSEISYSLETFDRNNQSPASVVFDVKGRMGVPLGTLRCFFTRAPSVGSIPVDRWVSVVGSHLSMEVLR